MSSYETDPLSATLEPTSGRVTQKWGEMGGVQAPCIQKPIESLYTKGQVQKG